MKFKFTVYYREKTEDLSWKMAEKFKLINAKNKEEAMQKFTKKYPNLVPICVFD